MSTQPGEQSSLTSRLGITDSELTLLRRIVSPFKNTAEEITRQQIVAARVLSIVSDIPAPDEVSANADAFASLLRSQEVDVTPEIGEKPIGILAKYGTFARDSWRRARELAIEEQSRTGDNELRLTVSKAANVLSISDSNKPSYKGDVTGQDV